jgi:hypothetical protein
VGVELDDVVVVAVVSPVDVITEVVLASVLAT